MIELPRAYQNMCCMEAASDQKFNERCEVLIWWTSEEDCKAIGDFYRQLPYRLYCQFADRLKCGTPGSVLVDREVFGGWTLPKHSSEDARVLALYLRSNHVGIAIEDWQQDLVWQLPGVVTNGAMYRVKY